VDQLGHRLGYRSGNHTLASEERIVTRREDVDRRDTADPGRATAHPIALTSRIECPRDCEKKRLERIIEVITAISFADRLAKSADGIPHRR
jgi:hypothetical protein